MARGRRGGGRGLSQAELEQARTNFDGVWEDDEKSTITIRNGTFFGPDGTPIEFTYVAPDECSFEAEGEVFDGFINAAGRLEWTDGTFWDRRRPLPSTAAVSVATGARAVLARDGVVKYDDDEEVGDLEDSDGVADLDDRFVAGADPAPSSAHSSRTMPQQDAPASMEPRRPSTADAPAQANRVALTAASDEARAKSQAGIDRARQAFLEEKARKAAALERARARAEAAQEADSRSRAGEGTDMARKAFEEERARKAAALERARAAKAVSQDRMESSTDRAKKTFEAEKVRAMMAARARGEAEEAPPAKLGNSPAPAANLPAAEAGALGGMARAKQAFEAARAKKAVEIARAKAKAATASRSAGPTGGFGVGPAGDANAGRFGARGTNYSNGFHAGGGASGGCGGGRSFGGSYGGCGYGGGSGYTRRLGLDSDDESDNASASELVPGIVVEMHGLKAKPELNGMHGVLVKFDDKKFRWQVRLENGTDLLLKEENLIHASQNYDDIADEQVEKEAQAIKTRAVGGKMRWRDDREGAIERGPGDEGNEFDVILAEGNNDTLHAARQVTSALVERGVCLCEANAPTELLNQAFEEAEALWKSGEFGPPMRVCDQLGQFEAQVWKDIVYRDEDKVLWINPNEPDQRLASMMSALSTLSENMAEFCKGVGEVLFDRANIKFTHLWNAMLSCYTGDRTYTTHIDNPHGCGPDVGGPLPDNGLRLTVCYYINVHWNPEDEYNGGGLDVFLTDPRTAPSSANAARRSKRLRAAPHADTLVCFLSERMAHQVIQTKGNERWYCLTMWCFDESIMSQFLTKFENRIGGRSPDDQYSDDEDDFDT